MTAVEYFWLVQLVQLGRVSRVDAMRLERSLFTVGGGMVVSTVYFVVWENVGSS